MKRFFVIFAVLVVAYCDNEETPPGDEFLSKIKELGKDCFDLDSCVELTFFHKDDRPEFAKCKKAKGYPDVLSHKEIACVAECTGHNNNWITGTAFNEKMVAMTKKRLAHLNWLTPKLDGIIEQCTKLEISPKDPNKCCGNILKMGWCIVAQVMLQTPDSEVRDSKHCEVLRGYLNTYKVLPPQKVWCHRIK